MIWAVLLAAALTSDQAAAILRAAADMPAAGSPVWLTDFQQAEALSLRTGRPLLIYNTSPTCRYCKFFDAWYSQVDLSGWVLLRVNVRQQNPVRVRAVPTHVIRVHGREIGRYEGLGNVGDAATYQRTLDAWRSQATSLQPHR